MIDTHCHLLPALDDGPRHQADAVLLARELSAQGVRRVLCTPHYSRLFPTSHAEAEERLRALRPVLRREGVELELRIIARPGADLVVAGRRVREAVGRAVERLLGLQVRSVTVLVDGVGS